MIWSTRPSSFETLIVSLPSPVSISVWPPIVFTAHDVVALAGRDRRAAGVRRLDVKRVVAGAELDVQRLEVAVGDAARERLAREREAGAHAEAGELVAR